MSGLNVTIATDANGWLEEHLPTFLSELDKRGHCVTVVNSVALIPESDVTFLLSLGQIVSTEILSRSRNTIVVHGSALPAGKGWSPVTWQILEGASEIPMTLFEAVDRVDAGAIYLQGSLSISDVDLIDEIRAKQADETVRLCLEFIDDYPAILDKATPQAETGETFYPRRTPVDSRVDPDKTLAEQFDLMRVSDPHTYPSFFDLRGRRFTLELKRVDDEPEG